MPKKNKNIEVMTSSQDHDWMTPQAFVDSLPFKFTLDACATLESTKCEEYISPKMDALREDRRWPGVVFCNPPYNNVRTFTDKAVAEAALGSTVVVLVPNRTETQWFHLIWKHATLICFVGKRIRFTKPETATGGKTEGAPFASVVAVFGELPPNHAGAPEYYGEAMSKIGTVIMPGLRSPLGNLWLHAEKE